MVDQSGDTTGNRERTETAEPRGSRTAQSADWLTAPLIRVALAFLGLVVLVYALGRAVGVDALEIVGDVLATRVGRWLLLALFALVLILIALRGFRTPAE
jgi:MFS family permease